MPRFTIDLDLLELVSSPTDSRRVVQLEGKRGDQTSFEVTFVRSGVAEELPAGAVLTFGAKLDGKFDSGAVIFEDSFALSGSGSTAKYTAAPSLSTEPLDALFLIDGNPSNDPAFVNLMAEFTWKTPETAPTSTRTFAYRVYNDVLRGDEDTPAALPDPEEWVKKTDAAILRPFESGDPNIPQSITITGELTDGTDPVVVPIVIPFATVDASGRPAYDDPGFAEINPVSPSGFELITGSGGWFSPSDVTLPSLADWSDSAIAPATGTPIVTAGPIFQGAFIGQQLRWEQETPGTYRWYIWNGAAWSELALA